jgi:capsid protein
MSRAAAPTLERIDTAAAALEILAANSGQTHAITVARPVAVQTVTTRRLDVRARFDAQFTTPESAGHFALMDALSVDAAASWMVRRVLRMKCRYEYHNNSVFMGLADTLGNYVISTGPKLQMLTGNKKTDKLVEGLFDEWSQEVDLAGALKNSCVAKCYNGEGFTLLRSNPNLDNPVKLDLVSIEADQVTSPLFGMYPSSYPDQYFDGVVLDPWGRPQTYHILRQHPGAFGAFVIFGYEFDPWPAQFVVHDFERIRPGQQRGIPEFLPALPNLANLRRYDLAVVAAAETAADYAVYFKTPGPATGMVDEQGNPVAEPVDCTGEVVPIESRTATFLPSGVEPMDVKPNQPGQQHETLINLELSSIGRAVNMPLFLVSMDARQANMASAYVVMQPFGKSVQVKRQNYNRLLDLRILPQFLREARLLGLLPADCPDKPAHTWRWDRINDHADPAKTATAAQTRLGAGITSRAQEAADLGLDMDEQDMLAARSYGVSVKDYRKALFARLQAGKGAVPPEGLVAPDGSTPPSGEDAAEGEDQP